MKKIMIFVLLVLIVLTGISLQVNALSVPLAVIAANSDLRAPVPRLTVKPALDLEEAISTEVPTIHVLAPKEESKLETQVTGWIEGLAIEPAYEAWRGAVRSVYPLGPGTHTWLVTLHGNGDEIIGYMIVSGHPDTQRYSLDEYGTGENPLYSMNTLYQSLIRHELIDPRMTYEAFWQNDNLISKSRIYLGPLMTFWKITIRHDSLYLDAKTCDLMPNLDDYIDQVDRLTTISPWILQVDKTVVVASFDPFERTNWLRKGAPTLQNASSLVTMLERQERVTFVGKGLDGKLTYALAVTGYDQWLVRSDSGAASATSNGTGDLYVHIDHDGDRVIPLRVLLQIGRFTY